MLASPIRIASLLKRVLHFPYRVLSFSSRPLSGLDLVMQLLPKSLTCVHFLCLITQYNRHLCCHDNQLPVFSIIDHQLSTLCRRYHAEPFPAVANNCYQDDRLATTFDDITALYSLRIVEILGSPLLGRMRVYILVLAC